MTERIVITPSERRAAVVQVIRAARRQLRLSLFRCQDMTIVDELACASARGVKVEALLTSRARGWRRRLNDLSEVLSSAGIVVRRYSGARYHAKYIVADDNLSLVGSLNYTAKCFSRTCDFLHLSPDPRLASELAALFEADCAGNPAPTSQRLIIGPEHARARITALLESARSEICIIDHRVKDSQIRAVLDSRRQAGVVVRVLGRGQLGGFTSHGKLMVVDRQIAVLGSMSLRRASLDRRRELFVRVAEPRCIRELVAFFNRFVAAPLERAA